MTSKKLSILLSITCGVSAANLYYNQPLLVMIAHSFSLTVSHVSVLSFIVQFSYAIGLFCLAPLGDSVRRKYLIIFLLIINAIASTIAGISHNFLLLAIMNIFIGLSSVTVQIIIPAASIISTKSERGRTVATVMSGLFAGIIFARLLSGTIGHYFGWHSIYLFASLTNCILAVGLYFSFPDLKASSNRSYFNLIKSGLLLILTKKPLRLSCISGFFSFFAFSAIWGSLAYLLSLPPYNYGSNIVGMFGLAGFVGMLSSRSLGALADKIHINHLVILASFAMLIAFMFIWMSSTMLAFLILGILIMDLGSRANLIGNQLRLFQLSEELRSRLNTIFMTCYFIGGAIGTKVGAQVSTHYHWKGISVLGMFASIVIIVINFYARPKLYGESNA